MPSAGAAYATRLSGAGNAPDGRVVRGCVDRVSAHPLYTCLGASGPSRHTNRPTRGARAWDNMGQRWDTYGLQWDAWHKESGLRIKVRATGAQPAMVTSALGGRPGDNMHTHVHVRGEGRWGGSGGGALQ